MLAAILLHKLFSQRHEGDQLRRHTFLKEKDKHRKLGGFMNDFQVLIQQRGIPHAS